LAVFGVIGGLLLAGGFVYYTAPNEPAFDGRSLSSWLTEWSGSYFDRTNAAAGAIRSIGTNGLPLLLSWVSKDESPMQKKVFRSASRFIPDSLNPISRYEWRPLIAAKALNLLGSQAMPAFPVLTNLMTKREHQLEAATALVGMGSDGIAVLTKAVTNGDVLLRLFTAMALEDAQSDFDKVIPALIESAKLGGKKPEDYMARRAAGTTLVKLHKEPNLVVPAFASFLTNQDEHIRYLGASLLVDFGAEARIAIPLLRQAETNSDPNVREAATNVIKEINANEGKIHDDAHAGT
jgi:hypothetical protein